MKNICFLKTCRHTVTYIYFPACYKSVIIALQSHISTEHPHLVNELDIALFNQIIFNSSCLDITKTPSVDAILQCRFHSLIHGRATANVQ